jgi:branched-chain amino acid transport system substrate-binding protein
MHYRRIVTFGLDFPLGWELVGGFQKTFEDAGGKVVQKIWAPLGFVDFSSYIKSIRPDADAVLLATALTPAEIIPKQYKEFGPKLPVIAVGPSCDESSIKNLGDEVLGTVSTMYYSAALNTPANKRFVQSYEQMTHDRCCHYAETAYTSGMWIHQAVDALKGQVDDREKFLAALKRVQLTNAPRGPVKLDGYGNPIENYYVCKAERVNGIIQNSVIHTFADVSQFWKYNPEEYLKQPPYDRSYPPCRYCQTNSP